MEQLTIWEINDLHLELDITDADTAERYELALSELSKDIPAVKPDGFAASAFIHAYCKAYRNLYDKIFGDGTAEKLFADIPDNIRKYNAVYGKFLAFVSGQINTANTEFTELHEKYLPKDAKNVKTKKGRRK